MNNEPNLEMQYRLEKDSLIKRYGEDNVNRLKEQLEHYYNFLAADNIMNIVHQIDFYSIEREPLKLEMFITDKDGYLICFTFFGFPQDHFLEYINYSKKSSHRTKAVKLERKVTLSKRDLPDFNSEIKVNLFTIKMLSKILVGRNKYELGKNDFTSNSEVKRGW